jgi:16S rRNA (cytidine1402-2'-O)-methyltransferase
MSGILYVVATPIGNLEDLAPRARQTLASVDLIAAEDTRHTGRLLSHFGIKTPQFALHEHNEREAVAPLLERLGNGQSLALVSDAGTPLISDPGFRLVQAAHAAGVPVIPVPGPSAVTAALSASGLATDRFCFEGFLPAKRPARRKRIADLEREPRTIVLYESVHRIADCVADLVRILGADRRAFIGREMTKLHEQCVSAELGEVKIMLADGAIPAKGEFVIVIEGAGTAFAPDINVDGLLTDLAVLLPAKEAARIAARATGLKRNALYRRLIELVGK